MKFGVIIPCRNINKYFNEYISPNFKWINENKIPLVFIDNKSEDDSVELLKTLSKNIIVNKLDKGFAHSVNNGIRFLIENFQCDAFLILSSDVIINNDLLLSLIRLDWKENWGYLSFSEDEVKKSDKLIIENNPTSASVFLIHKKTIHKVGFYDEDYYMYGEDNDYFIRIKSKKLLFVKSPEIFYHKGQGYSNNNKYSKFISSLCYRNYLLVYKKNKLYGKLITAILKELIFVLLGNYIFFFIKKSREVKRFTDIKFKLRILYFFKALMFLFRVKNEI